MLGKDLSFFLGKRSFRFDLFVNQPRKSSDTSRFVALVVGRSGIVFELRFPLISHTQTPFFPDFFCRRRREVVCKIGPLGVMKFLFIIFLAIEQEKQEILAQVVLHLFRSESKRHSTAKNCVLRA
uniref:(northern house mosquito) hypothetical protein n=1 Tax=Culex pipiens TaxID=7175 RepID=A0A8D8J7A7_CULPI